MKPRKRRSARVPLDRIERLFAYRRVLEEKLARVDDAIGVLLIRLASRNVYTADIAHRLARVIGEAPTLDAIARLDARLRQSRARARRRRGHRPRAPSPQPSGDQRP